MTRRPVLTPTSAYAAAYDAGNRHARAHGRDVWDETDLDTAVQELNRLMALIEPRPEEDQCNTAS